MPNLNPFTHKTVSYHRLSKESTEQESDPAGSNVSAVTRDSEDENAYMLAKHLHRPRRSCFKSTCSYILTSLVSLIIGLVFSQLFTLEYSLDGYLGA